MGKTFKDDDLSNVAKNLGQRGGLKTAKRYGAKHFKKMAKTRWEKREGK